MNVLVIGGTGKLGSHVVRELAQRNANVTVLSRDRTKTTDHPAGVKTVEGNLQQPATIRGVFDGMDAVFLLNPVSQTELHDALVAVCEMRLAGIQRLVHLSVLQAGKAAWIPHFGAKAGVEKGIRRSDIPYTILRPANFYQNDYMLKDAILKTGIYPQPLGDAGVSRVDIRDVAEIAATVLLSSDHDGKTYDLGGPPYTGHSMAAVWSKALGREIKYGGNDLDAWAQQSLQYMPDWMVFDFKMMFAYLHTGAWVVSEDDIDFETELLGHAPRSLEAFAKETAVVWSA